MNKRVIAVISAGLWLIGCSKDNVEEPLAPVTYDPTQVVCVATDVPTRGTPVTSVTQMTDLGVFCAYTAQSDWTATATPNKMFNTKLVRNSGSGEWQYTGTPVEWAAANASDRFSFFAYAPMASGLYSSPGNPTGNGIQIESTASTAGIPKLTYTVPLLNTVQPDLMVAVPKYNVRRNDGVVNFSMQHALTCVGFQIAGTGEKVVDIRISGVKSIGRLSLDGGNIAWDFTGFTQPTSLNFSSSINTEEDGYYVAKPVMSTNLMKGNGYLMMIPQTLDQNARITISLQDGTVRVISLDALQWTPGQRVNYKITLTPAGSLVCTPSSVVIPRLGVTWAQNPINVVCTYPDQRWVLNTLDAFVHLSSDPSGSNSSNVITGVGSKTIYVAFDANTTSTNRVTSLYYNNAQAVVTFNQVRNADIATFTGGGTLPTGTTPCVGAFWRANQKGERIIRIPINSVAANAGAWTASVLWTDGSWAADDIVLSTTATTDPNVSFTNQLTPGDAESYPVTGAQAVGGTAAANGTIYFRVGLKTNYAPTEAKPVRYAVLLLQYGTPLKEHLVMLRQGHDPDYVMRTTETATGSTLSSRPLAVRYSPYNLTITNMTIGGVSILNHPILSIEGKTGTFTDYPSQIGAYFQWANILNPLVAFNPVNPLGNITGWVLSAPLGYWEAGVAPLRLVDSQDGSPKDYTLSTGVTANFRRPNDGITTAATPAAPDASTSEVRQSLWLAPQAVNVANSNNSMAGYLADGFFDRRMRNTAAFGTNGVADCSTSWGDKNVAYAGMLYYNPATGASVFFPAAGARSAATGNLIYPGYYGYYWSSSAPDGTNAWQLQFGNGLNQSTSALRWQANPIRCVRE